MPEVVGIKFKRCGKTYDFETGGIDVKEGDSVIVESDFGLSIGTVVKSKKIIEAPDRELKKIMRLATADDFRTREENKKLEKESRAFCVERVMARGLPMKLVGAESTLDRKRVVFYFTADGRIDFRELVKDLAAKFKTRIEMRQIGVRDEAKLVGGIGICGRELCCKTFLSSFDPVSIKMAKRQELVLNVGKLSGLCSRLMCCLRYEYEGDMNTISADDEIPIGIEDVPINAIEEKISPRGPREENPSKTPGGGRQRPRRKDKRFEREPRPAETRKANESKEAPVQTKQPETQVQPAQPVQSGQPATDEGREKRHDRRHRRRRNKK